MRRLNALEFTRFTEQRTMGPARRVAPAMALGGINKGQVKHER